MQIVLAFLVDQFSGAKGARTELLAHLGGHLKLAGHAPFGTNGQGGRVTVLSQSHGSGVVSHRSMGLESMELVRVANVGRADLCDRVNDVLCGQRSLSPDEAIAGVMEVVFAMQVLLKGQLGKRIAGAVKLFHRGFEFFRRVRGDDQFRF